MDYELDKEGQNKMNNTEKATAENLLEIITQGDSALKAFEKLISKAKNENEVRQALEPNENIVESFNKVTERIENVLYTTEAKSVYKMCRSSKEYKDFKKGLPDFGLTDKEKTYIKIIADFNATIATLLIGLNHGITPQAQGSIKELREQIKKAKHETNH